MPLPTASSANTVSGLIVEARAIKQFASDAIVAMAAGPVSANSVLGLCQRLNTSVVNVLTPAANSSPTMAELARVMALADGPTAAAQVQAVIAAVNQSIAWVVSNFPTSGGNPAYLLKDTLNADGSVTVRTFTPGQTAGFRAQLQTIVDAIS